MNQSEDGIKAEITSEPNELAIGTKNLNGVDLEVGDDGIISIRVFCRGWVKHQKAVSSETLNNRIGGKTFVFRLDYVAQVSTELCEDGNCGPLSCNLSCTLRARSGGLNRTLSYMRTTTDGEAIGTKFWARSDSDMSHGKNCNAMERDNLPGVVNAYLAPDLWRHIIQDDRDEVMKIIENYRP